MSNRREIPIRTIYDRCAYRNIQSIKVSAFNEEACMVAELDESHRHDFYEIVWLRKGAGRHTIDVNEYSYNGSTVFLLSPGQIHRLEPKEKADGFVCKFLPALFTSGQDFEDYLTHTGLFDNIDLQPVLQVTPALHAVFEDVFSKMETEFNTGEEDRERILVAYLKILLTHISRLKRSGNWHSERNTDVNRILFQNYKDAIEKHFRTSHGVQFYADLLHTQVRHLNKLAKKYTGRTAIEIISGRIILEARRELYHNHQSIKEISFALGFEDPAYFTRFFRKNTGLSPQEYKLSQRQAPVELKMNVG